MDSASHHGRGSHGAHPIFFPLFEGHETRVGKPSQKPTPLAFAMPSVASLLVRAARDASRAARAARSAAAAAASSQAARPGAPAAASFGPHCNVLGGDSCSYQTSFSGIDPCSDPVSPYQFSGVSSPGTSNSIFLCFIKGDLMPLYSIVGRIGPRLSISFRSE